MKFKNIATILTLSLITSLGIVGCNSSDTKNKDSESQEAVELNISAAASLKEAMEKIEEEYKKVNENVTLVVNYGASGSLQQQIEQGAPCDVFISAGQKQMKALDEASLLLEGTYKDLLENDLVLIASKDSDVSNLDDLITNKVKHIAVGEPSSVPAGKYADEVLVNLDLKDKIKDKLVFAKDVKEVLAWTQSGNAEVGFVYYSDTINTDNIKIVETTPSTSHSAIVYPIAVIKESKKPEAAKEFEDFLLAHLDNYLIPSDQVAIFIDSHNADHVVLLLTSNGYSRVPVLTKDKHYLGTISLTDIKRYQDEHNLQEWEMVNRDIGPMTSDVVETVEDNANLNEVMHKLVNNPFLPVVDSQGIFKGIITRKSILKAVNSLLHDFTHDYIIIPKTTDNSDH